MRRSIPSAPPPTALAALAVAALAAAVVVAGCARNAEIEPAPAPYRPKAVEKPKPAKTAKTDCRRTDPRRLPPAMAYRYRSIIEADNLAKEGVTLLREAEDRKLSTIERQDRITESVDLMIKALKADPYNVHATYNLAAAYARMGREQCAVNLLARLVELRKLPSQKAEVERHVDRLFGRGKYRGTVDPDFNDLRDDSRFREVVKNF